MRTANPASTSGLTPVSPPSPASLLSPVGPLLPLRDGDKAPYFNFVLAIFLAAAGYQLLLCFISTHGLPASRAMVGLAEVLIFAIGLPVIMLRLLPGTSLLILCSLGMLCLGVLVSGELNTKAFRDLAIPFYFFWLGCNFGRPHLADRCLKWVIALVLSIGLFELFFVDLFTEIFDIFGYYVNIGSLQVITDYVRESRLQMNGLRPEGIGRTLFPGLLGPHRISSIFLEPIAMGNFATICAAWGLSKDKTEWRSMVFFLAAAFAMMVLSDSRFSLVTVNLMIVVRLLLHGRGLYLAFFGPFIVVAGVILLGYGVPIQLVEDNFHGRLALTGSTLLAMDIKQILGLAFSNFIFYGDQGYANVFFSFGVPLCLILWVAFWLLPLPDEASQRFRTLVSVYMTLILSISGSSLLALKTAGILWLLVGCSMRIPAPAPRKIVPLDNHPTSLLRSQYLPSEKS